MEKWRTKISVRKDGELYVRGYSFSELLSNKSFFDVLFLLWRGSFPEAKEIKMCDVMLVSAVEHGVEAPSTFVSRTIASTGNAPSVAIASGILAMGERHGGAIEKAAQVFAAFLSAGEIAENAAEKKIKIPGYGHRVYKKEDPRTTILLKKAKDLGFYGEFVKKAVAVELEFFKKTGKKIPLNIDGVLAALLLELGFKPEIARAFFILPRVIGLAAHVAEEISSDEPYHRLGEDDVEYNGPAPLKS